VSQAVCSHCSSHFGLGQSVGFLHFQSQFVVSQMQCEELPCAQCTVKCEKPQCSVRCPKDMCEKDDCPKCETVCSPAVCRTSCVAPEPNCSPLCEATNCDWKCKKPTLCPKPKCELQCEHTACDTQDVKTSCPCTNGAVASAIEMANQASQAGEAQPTFMEVMHTIKFKNSQGDKVVCPCEDPPSG